jgi:hypothetical protein
LQNEWVQARDAANSGNAITSTTGWYTPPATVNRNWGAIDGTSARLLASAMHDYFNNTFSYTGMDYQMGGYINDGAGTNGSADGTDVYFGSQSGQYWVRSSDVVYHEYTHNTVYHIYGRWIGGGGGDYYSQGAAMDEGFSDYFACTKNNDPIQAEDCGVSRNLDNNTYTWDSNLTKYFNCQVIGGACWDIRQSAGQSVTDNLVFRALQISPHAHNFTDFETNVMIADENYYSGNHRSQVFQAFANHGIYTSYGAPSQPKNLRITNTSATPINLAWDANPEPDISSYQVWRNVVNEGAGWQTIGTTSSTSYTDQDYTYAFNFGNAQLQYKIRAKDNSNNFSVYSDIASTTGEPNFKMPQGEQQVTEQVAKEIPTETGLYQNYPNPFNPSTVIKYQLPMNGFVKLSVFDVLGREAGRLVNETKPAGFYTTQFNASQLPSGVYFARIFVALNEGRPFVRTIKMQLTK